MNKVVPGLNHRPAHLLLYGLLVAANIGCWLWAWALFSEQPALLGTAAFAYLLGLRHAFDADHIAAIDNVVRRLIFDGRPPHLAGFFFALGHSSIVILVCLAFALAATRLEAQFTTLGELGRIVAPGASGLFLIAIGVINLTALIRLQSGSGVGGYESRGGGGSAPASGMLARVLPRGFASPARAWQMFPIGVILALSFDTAAQVSLLALSAAPLASDGPLASIGTVMVYPALFAAGMCLMDTADTALIAKAYCWALRSPERRKTYNLAITLLSITAAFVVGIGQLLGFASSIWSGSTGALAPERLLPKLEWINANVGFIVTFVLLAVWGASRIHDRNRMPAVPRHVPSRGRSHD